MKKSYFWGLLLAVMALIPAQNAFADYCTFSGNSTHTERRLQSFTLTDGVTDAAVQNVQPALRSAVYKDMTSTVFETSPGATISFKALDWKGSWMHGYAYIDYDNDQVFNQDNELVSYSFYSPTDAGTGTNSKGETVGNGGGITTSSMPNWVIPTDLAAGDYRFRFKGDWNSKDPCGITGSTNNTAANGGFMVDITIRVVAAIPERTITVDVVPAEGGSVTGAGTAAGNITLTATPNPGYEFVNWTLNGEEVGTDVAFTDAAEGDKTYVANFAALTAYPEMSYIYTNGMDQANRYLKEVVATAGETVTTVFSAATTSELPKIDPDVVGTATTVGAYVDKTSTPIIVPQGTTEFTVNFKAWTESMTVGSSSASCQLNWTQQAVFVDWNNNFYFYDEGENYGKNSDNMPNPELIVADGYTRTFSVPEGVQPGVYRMRVCYFEPNGNNAQQWQNTLFEKGNCTTRNGKTYDFAIEVIEVTPETPVYVVSVATADEAMGTAEVSATEVEEGTEVTFTATAAEGYQFVNWTSGEEVVSTENPYTVAVTAEMALTANFELIPVPKYAVSVATADEAMGTAEVSATEVKEGEEVTFTATANLGYKFIGWSANGETVSTENPYTTAVTAEMSLVANFEALTPAIIVTNDTTGVERQFTFDAFVEGAKVQIDWGNGELEEYDIAFYDSWTTWTTTITGTLKGEGVVKIYGDQIRSFDCSYSASYPVKVTSLDLTGCPNLYELVCNSNQLTALDLSANTALVKLTANNSAFASGVNLSANTALTTIDFNDAGLPSIDLSANTALTSVKLNNNALGSLDVSANTALTTLYANNTGLTTIDLSANVVLKNLYVNENQLTTLDISNMVAGSYTFANDNQLTELITAPEMLTSKTRINIKNNNFTLATLPAITGINAYNYAPQNAMTIATEITEGEELDLSSQAMVGENATVYAWYTAEGEEFTGYTVEGGKFVFDVEADTELYCTMTNASFANFSGANVFKTTNIVVKALIPAIVVTVTPDVERQFSFEVATASKLFIDWGNGELVETETIVASDPDPSWIPYLPTIINGTPVGEGIVKIYGDGITYFDCSYSSSYPSKVTSLDVTNATSLIALEACTNEIATLDLSKQSSLLKLTAYSNPTLSTIVWPTTNVLTSVTLNDCALSEIDFSSCTALTSLNVNNNTGMGGIDVSALTALTTLRADNIGMTTIDLSANTVLKNLYVNNNQLTTVDVSNMVAGLYLYANNNQLTSIVAGESNVTSKSRVQITNNNFTLATLPAFTAISKVGTTGYNYAPQAAMTIATEITEGEELDLSAQNNIVGRASEAQVTDYTWYTTDGEEFTSYTETDGKFVFDVTEDTELYCTMTTEAFSSFSGANVFKTTNIVVKYVAPTTYTVTVTTFDGGTVAIQGYEGETAQIEEGTQVTVVATPAEGFEFVSWTDADDAWDTDLTFDAEYTFTVTRDINLKAWFSQLPVVTTCEVLVNIAPTEDYGTVVIEGVEGLHAVVEVGTEVTAVATPAEGKIFEGWFTFVGDELSTEATYTFTATEDVIVVAWFTDAPEAEYCTYEGKSTHSERRLNAVTITDGTNSTAVSSIQPYFRGDVYVDKTDVVFPSYAGATVNFSEFDFKGEWMHAYVYIDYNNDKVFDTTVNADGTTGGELVAFTFYSETDSGTGVNSLGETVSNYTIPMVNYLPAFTLPADLEKGEYRVRVKTDWCHLDPCGHPTESANKLTANGACIADFTMSIDEENGVEFAEADGAQVYAADGVIYINGYEGDVKVVNTSGQVVKDVNVNGNDKLEMAAGLYMVVTGDQVTKVVVK